MGVQNGALVTGYVSNCLAGCPQHVAQANGITRRQWRAMRRESERPKSMGAQNDCGVSGRSVDDQDRGIQVFRRANNSAVGQILSAS